MLGENHRSAMHRTIPRTTKSCGRSSRRGRLSSHAGDHMSSTNEDRQRGGRPMIYGRPVIRAAKSLDVFFKRLLPQAVPLPADMDWRAKKLNEFIDLHEGRVRLRIGDTCKKLGFSM